MTVHVQTGNMLDVVVEGRSIGLKQRDSDHRKYEVIWLPDPEAVATTLLAEVRRLKPATTTPSAEVLGWQPIETAPKDGTPVLLVWHWDSGIHTGADIVLERWYCRAHAHSSRHHDCPNEQDCNMNWGAYAGVMSHWMPLPLPPHNTKETT